MFQYTVLKRINKFSVIIFIITGIFIRNVINQVLEQDPPGDFIPKDGGSGGNCEELARMYYV